MNAFSIGSPPMVGDRVVSELTMMPEMAASAPDSASTSA